MEYNSGMNRSARILVAVLALVLLVAGTALATRMVPTDRQAGPLAASHEASPGESEDQNEPSESPDTTANGADSNQAGGAGAPLTDAHAQALVTLLTDAGIDGVTTDELKTLAAKYGVGGAVRLEAWAKATGKSVSDLAAMVDGGMGWGAIAHQLEAADASLHLSPGIGWIMGHGHGHGHGQGQGHGAGAKPKDASGQS